MVLGRKLKGRQSTVAASGWKNKILNIYPNVVRFLD